MNNAQSIFYGLYCLNFFCRLSIFQQTPDIQVVFTEANLLATHHCACCHQPLVSAMDLEIEKLVADTGVKITVR